MGALDKLVSRQNPSTAESDPVKQENVKVEKKTVQEVKETEVKPQKTPKKESPSKGKEVSTPNDVLDSAKSNKTVQKKTKTEEKPIAKKDEPVSLSPSITPATDENTVNKKGPGRPVTGSKTVMQTYTIQISVIEKLELAAAARQMSKSAYISKLINDDFNKNQKSYESFKDLKFE